MYGTVLRRYYSLEWVQAGEERFGYSHDNPKTVRVSAMRLLRRKDVESVVMVDPDGRRWAVRLDEKAQEAT